MGERNGAVLVAGRQLYLTDHAIERYHERVRPALVDTAAALAEMLAVMPAAGVWLDGAPEWLSGEKLDRKYEAAGYILIGDDVAFPVIGTAILTCATRGGLSPERRASKREGRRKKAQHRRQLRASGQKPGDETRGKGSRRGVRTEMRGHES